MSIEKLEQELAEAREHEKEVCKELSFPPRNDPAWQKYDAASNRVLTLERELAAAKGEEYAVPLDFPVRWDVGAPLPYLLRNDYKTFLTFYIAEPDPDWDGTYVKVKDPASGEDESLALVEFAGCVSAKLGTPNDEVLDGHPLHGRGLDSYTAQRVINSRWLAAAEEINSVHRCYDREHWQELNHYVFWFHDTTFECLARSYTVEPFREDMESLLSLVCQRLLV